MAVGVVKMVATFSGTLHSRVGLPIFHHRLADRYTPISTNAHQVGKSLRLPQNIFSGGRQLPVTARSGRFTG